MNIIIEVGFATKIHRLVNDLIEKLLWVPDCHDFSTKGFIFFQEIKKTRDNLVQILKLAEENHEGPSVDEVKFIYDIGFFFKQYAPLGNNIYIANKEVAEWDKQRLQEIYEELKQLKK